MISKKIREEFEANYPMPFACGWNSMTNEYQCIWYEHEGEPDTEVPILEHNDRLAVWIKSREQMVIGLPAIRAKDYDPLGNVAYREECRVAIEAIGLKVMP